MKKHLVNIWFDTVLGHFSFIGLVDEVLNSDNKPIVFPNSIFKSKFGIELPSGSTITLI